MKKGFTLLELLIGITIFTIIAGAVYASIYLGIRVYKHEDQSDSGIQQIILCFDMVEQCLFSTYINPDDENTVFKGSEERVDFSRVNKNGQLESISIYREQSGAGGASELLIERKKYSLLQPEETPPDKELINNSISSLKFSYYDPELDQWYEEWPDEKKAPSQVKVEIGLIDQPAAGGIIDMEKYINIPAAAKIQTDVFAGIEQ